MKRKSLVIALAAAMMLSMTACGVTARSASTENAARTEETETEEAEAEPEDAADETEPEEAADEADTAEGEADDADAETAADEEEVANEEDEEQEATASSGRYERGNVTDTSYESEWIGLRYDLPDGFTMATEEEMDAVLQLGSEMIYEDNADMIVDYSKMVLVYEMMAMDSTNNSVTVLVERTSLKPEEYAGALEAQMALVDGVSIEKVDEDTDAQLGGVDFYRYCYEMNYNGVTVYQDYYMAPRNGRMIQVLVSYADKSVRDTMVDGFAPY
ncbi:MAG: hypothetical protein NC434_04950 [Ruminococcus sp.]|nr:hypothetical protein [Ruminococcus sp.]